MNAQVMLAEIESLYSDFKTILSQIKCNALHLSKKVDFSKIKHIYLVGSGDSYFAALASEIMFCRVKDICCKPVSTFKFLEYDSRMLGDNRKSEVIIIVISASGNSPIIKECLVRAKVYGLCTVILTSNNKGEGIAIANHAIVVTLANKLKSPGIRTYQASLLGLNIIALQICSIKGCVDNLNVEYLYKELDRINDTNFFSLQQIRHFCFMVYGLIKDSRVIMFLGSGPDYGTACYSAAKMIEASGIHTEALDIEEWWHTGRFSAPYDMPLFIIAPSGVSYNRAHEIAEVAVSLGRKVFFLTNEQSTKDADYPIFSVKKEIFRHYTPFLFHLFSCYISSFISTSKESKLFQTS